MKYINPNTLWTERSKGARWLIVGTASLVGIAVVGNATDRGDKAFNETVAEQIAVDMEPVVTIDQPATVTEPAVRVTTTTAPAPTTTIAPPYAGLPVHNALISIMVEQFSSFDTNERALLCTGSEIFFESYWTGFRGELEAQGSEPIVTKDKLRAAFDMALVRVCS